MNKRKIQAIIWMFVLAVLTIQPFFTWYYFGGFAVIVSPFALVLLIKLIKEFKKGYYD